MLKKILIGLLVIIVIICGIAATQPNEFKVERSTTVNAAPEVVFANVNDLKKWVAWSPWEKIDPNMKTTFEGAPEGVGAIHTWAGNKDVGEGRMTIVESQPASKIQLKLEFLKPFEATNDTVFTFVGDTSQTTVNWAMTGKNNFMSKIMCLFMNMDKMVGGDFEKGLAALKQVSETPVAAQ